MLSCTLSTVLHHTSCHTSASLSVWELNDFQYGKPCSCICVILVCMETLSDFPDSNPAINTTGESKLWHFWVCLGSQGAIDGSRPGDGLQLGFKGQGWEALHAVLDHSAHGRMPQDAAYLSRLHILYSPTQSAFMSTLAVLAGCTKSRSRHAVC